MVLFSATSASVKADVGISLYTPYTKIVVPPGESVEYTVEVSNKSNDIKDADISLSGLPKEWVYTLKAGGYSINKISVLPGEKKTLSLKIEIPMKVNKGNHQFKVIAGNYDVLSLIINVSEQGTFKTEYTSDQVNLQGNAKSNFNFSTRLKNQTGEKQVYALQATAVEIDPNSTTNIAVEVKPPYNVEAGTYKIPVEASNRSTSAALELEVVITGTYDMELTTPTGLLSTEITAGSKKRIELNVINTGSSDLNDIVFRSSTPKNWDLYFEPDTLSHLKPGNKAQVYATIKAYEKAIPGDYAVTLTAQTNEANSKASFRVSVKTSLLWGWLGIFIVIATLAVIFYLFRKYGRR